MENSQDVEVELYDELEGDLNDEMSSVGPSSNTEKAGELPPSQEPVTYQKYRNLARYYPAVRPESTASRLSSRAAAGSSDSINEVRRWHATEYVYWWNNTSQIIENSSFSLQQFTRYGGSPKILKAGHVTTSQPPMT